jgi:hypothetical protein
MKSNYSNLISLAAIVALTGFVTSGPLGLVMVRLVKPQPEWVSAEVFSNNYHIVQDLPFYFGFVLIAGMLMLAAGHYLDLNEGNGDVKFYLMLSLLLTAAFSALIFFNYVCQTTFVRHLALNYKEEYDTLIFTFSMANPMSLCWAIEMWGYGILGVATWLMAPYYTAKNNFIRWLLIANGVVSVLTAVLTAMDNKWLLSTIGLVAYTIWNLLMMAIAILIYRYHKKMTLRI